MSRTSSEACWIQKAGEIRPSPLEFESITAGDMMELPLAETRLQGEADASHHKISESARSTARALQASSSHLIFLTRGSFFAQLAEQRTQAGQPLAQSLAPHSLVDRRRERHVGSSCAAIVEETQYSTVDS